MQLDKRERALLLKISEDGDGLHRSQKRNLWLSCVFGAGFLAIGLWDGFGPSSDYMILLALLHFAIAVHQFVELRRARLIRKLIDRLDEKGLSWMDPS